MGVRHLVQYHHHGGLAGLKGGDIINVEVGQGLNLNGDALMHRRDRQHPLDLVAGLLLDAGAAHFGGAGQRLGHAFHGRGGRKNALHMPARVEEGRFNGMGAI